MTQQTFTSWKESSLFLFSFISHSCYPLALPCSLVCTRWPCEGLLGAQQCLSLARGVCTLTVQCVCGGGGTRCNSLLSPSVYVMLTRSTCNKSWTELSWLWKCETGRISAVNMRVGPFLQTEICYKLPQQGWARPVRWAKTKSAGEMFFLSLVKRNAAFLALPTPLCGKSLYNAVRELVRLAYSRWNGACGRWNTQRRM